jgi:hypothetical protein
MVKCGKCCTMVDATKICDIVTDVSERFNQLDYTIKELYQCDKCKSVFIR